MIGNTNSQMAGTSTEAGDADLISAYNYTGTVLNAGDRVLLKRSSDNIKVNTLVEDKISSMDYPNLGAACFTTDEDFIMGCGSSYTFHYTKSEGVWVGEKIKVGFGTYALIPDYVSGVGLMLRGASISNSDCFLIQSHAGAFVKTVNKFTPVYYDKESGYYWGQSVTISSAYQGKCYYSSDALGTTVVSVGTKAKGAVLGFGTPQYIAGDANGKILYLYEIDPEAKVCNLLKSSTVATDSHSLIAATGTDVGDYVLMTDGRDPNTSGSGIANYGLYGKYAYMGKSVLLLCRITEDGFEVITDSAHILARYFTEACLIHYNSQNKVLVMSTASDVKVFLFNDEMKEFQEVVLEIPEYPAHAAGFEHYIYQTAISTDKRTLFVGLRLTTVNGTSAGDFSGIFYDIEQRGENVWLACKNSVAELNRQAVQGMVVSDAAAIQPEPLGTDSSSPAATVKVKTILPPILDYAVNIVPDPDSFVFEGSAV